MKTLLKISDNIDKVCGWAIIVLFAVMTITYSMQIFLRYVVGTGVKWTEELTRYADIWAIIDRFRDDREAQKPYQCQCARGNSSG